jgi:uncharacterized protein
VSDVAYIDTSAFVKLFVEEPESDAVAAAIGSSWRQVVASEILAVEAFRTALRRGGEAPALAAQLLRQVILLPFSPEIRADSCRLSPPELRTLDAIHLATAISVADRIGAIFTYDKRLAQACTDAGLQVLAPA